MISINFAKHRGLSCCCPKHSINVGPAMMAKIIIENSQVLHGAYRPLTPDESADKEGQVAQRQLEKRDYDRLGSQVLPRD